MSDPYAKCVGQEQGKDETPGPGNQQQYVPISSGFCSACGQERRTSYYKYETHFSTQLSKIANDTVGIRVADVALGLRRVPSGFYSVVNHSGLEWRTENKPSSVNDDVVEWDGPIPM